MSMIVFTGTPNAGHTATVLSDILDSALRSKELLDHLVAVRGNPATPDWNAIAVDMGCTVSDAPTLFAALDQLNAYMVSAYSQVLTFYGNLR